MAKLTSKQRKALPKKEFALPRGTKKNGGKPAFPIDTKNRAKVAKSYAAKEVKTGNITKAQKEKIDAMANKKLGKSRINEIRKEMRAKGRYK